MPPLHTLFSAAGSAPAISIALHILSAATFTMGSDLGTMASRICSRGCGGAQMEMKANDRRRVAGAEAAARMHLDHWVHLGGESYLDSLRSLFQMM
uniref:Uncharacterized protein n=1 Tax=Oryza rufipogon TaxID=4529 RepID=A0A0E0QYZ5_ORYRU